MTTYNISINDELASIVEETIKTQKYANRSEFFRDLLRKFFVKNEHSIEEINEHDEDYNIIQAREKNASFTPLSELI